MKPAVATDETEVGGINESFRRRVQSLDGITLLFKANESRMLLSRTDGGVAHATMPTRSADEGVRPAVQKRDGRDRLLVFLDAHAEIIRLISKTGKLNRALGRIAALAEEFFEPVGCVIQLVDVTTGALRNAALAGVPSGYAHGLAAGNAYDDDTLPGLAVLTRQPVLIADLREDGIPDKLRELPLVYDLRSCWIYPAADKNDATVGIFALFFREPRRPDGYESRIASAMANLVGFAIQQDRRSAALRSADERFAALAASVPGVVYQRIVTPDGKVRYTYISDAAKDLFGVSPEEILADPNALFDCHGPEYRARFRERLLQASAELKLWDVEATIIARDGKRKFTHAIARPHRRPDGTVVWDGVILDATRIKEAELEAAAIASRTREAITESLSQGFLLFDDADRLVATNSHFRALYPQLADVVKPGLCYADLARMEIERDLDGVPGDRDERIAARMRAHVAGRRSSEQQLADGRWVYVNEHRTLDGATVCLHTDITPLKHRELALTRSNRDLEDFAFVASHDLQEPLRKIEAFGDRLTRRCREQLDEDGRNYLDRIGNAAARMRALIGDLLVYSRITTKAQPFTRCALVEIVEGVVSDLQIRIEECRGRVEVDALPVIDADATQMRQLFQNLIANALKFNRKDVPPVVRVTFARTREEPGFARSVEIRVADNGIGFDMRYADRIFGIFQRLHSRGEYEGTGIGLATCRKIVERHNGSIRTESAPGEGATFAITLPVRQLNIDALGVGRQA